MNNLAPANGAEVDIPTLSWDVTPGALTYTVTISNGIGQQVDTATTHGTVLHAQGPPAVPSANNPYTWTVYAETAEGTVGGTAAPVHRDQHPAEQRRRRRSPRSGRRPAPSSAARQP